MCASNVRSIDRDKTRHEIPSRIAHRAQSAYEKEVWVRKLPLLVLIYEGIVQKVFEYDYAPESTVVKNARLYLNVSLEAVDDLDDMIE